MSKVVLSLFLHEVNVFIYFYMRNNNTVKFSQNFKSETKVNSIVSNHFFPLTREQNSKKISR